MRGCLLQAAVLSVLVGVAGCTQATRREGPELVKVTGMVSLDGQPLEGAHIRFSPESKGPAAFAISDKRGRFELRTFDPGDGAVPGKYAISVTKDVTEGGMEFDNEAAMEAYLKEHGRNSSKRTTVRVLPEKYSSRKTSGLSAEVNVAKNNYVEILLSSK